MKPHFASGTVLNTVHILSHLTSISIPKDELSAFYSNKVTFLKFIHFSKDT